MGPLAKRICDAPKISMARLRDMFDKCDTNKDGRVNKRDLIKSFRQDDEIAKFFQQFFQLPKKICQEGGSRDRFEEVFQKIAQDGDREIRWVELLAYCWHHRVVD